MATTPATTGDEVMVDEIHEELKQEHLLPSRHLLDSGYVHAQTLASSQHDYGVEMVGPTRADCQWQANRAQGFDASQFVIDWEHQQATCPQGHASISWTPTVDDQNNEIIKIRFSSDRLQTLSLPDPLYSFPIESSSSLALDPTTKAI